MNLKELMVQEQLTNVAKKELVPLLKDERFKSLKEAATWADDHVLVHHGLMHQRSAGSHKYGRVR